MDSTRHEAIQDLVAMLSALFFVLGVGLGLCLVVFYTLGPTVLGPLDQPVENRFLVIPFLFVFVVILTIGSTLGGMAWIVVMSRFLPKETLYKWLTYSPQIKPLLEFNLWLLNRAYSR
jgi:hypothetical protein